MRVELRFQNFGEQAEGDAFAVLALLDGSGEGQVVHDPSAYTHFVRGAMGATNRSREILVTNSESSARMLVGLRQSEGRCHAHIAEIAVGAWCASVIHCDGHYSSGLPTIFDLRMDGDALEIDGEIQDLLDIEAPFQSIKDCDLSFDDLVV